MSHVLYCCAKAVMIFMTLQALH